jgi:hypothetical protein
MKRRLLPAPRRAVTQTNRAMTMMIEQRILMTRWLFGPALVPTHILILAARSLAQLPLAPTPTLGSPGA